MDSIQLAIPRHLESWQILGNADRNVLSHRALGNSYLLSQSAHQWQTTSVKAAPGDIVLGCQRFSHLDHQVAKATSRVGFVDLPKGLC
jgi:hypothetical protein